MPLRFQKKSWMPQSSRVTQVTPLKGLLPSLTLPKQRLLKARRI
jgi:hypothetical protein